MPGPTGPPLRGRSRPCSSLAHAPRQLARPRVADRDRQLVRSLSRRMRAPRWRARERPLRFGKA
jgi:hypothetical protein